MKNLKFMTMALLAIMCVTAFTACGSDDDEITEGTEGNAMNTLYVNEKGCGSLPYGFYLDNGDGTASLMFANIDIAKKGLPASSSLTYLSVRVPGLTGVQTGTFSEDVDADFDVNRNVTTEDCDLTGWSLNLTMTVAKSGSKYVVNVTSSDFHIFDGNDEMGNGKNGPVRLHYEGVIEPLTAE